MQRACSVLYCHLWPVWLDLIFFHIMLQTVRHSENVIEHKMCILILSTCFVWTLSHSKKNKARYYHTCTYVFMWSTRYSGHILMKLELSRQLFGYSSYTKFNDNPSSGSRVILCGQTDMTELIVAFLNFATRFILTWHSFLIVEGPCNWQQFLVSCTYLYRYNNVCNYW